MYDAADRRFMAVDPVKGSIRNPLTLVPYTYVVDNPEKFADPLGLERIVVSGGVYRQDKQEEGEFYYEFIEPAIKQLKTYAKDSKGETVTWLIADAGWTPLDKDNFRRTMEVNFSGGVKIRYINSSDDLIDYMNNMDENDRLSDKITNISFFSHGIPGYIPLGFNYEERDKGLDFIQVQIQDINPNAFDNPYAQFYSCNTGAGEYSFAQKWVDRVDGRAWAILPKPGEFDGKTVYAGINYGQPLTYRTSRFLNGFSLFGSANLPVAADHAQFKMFTPSQAKQERYAQ
jgi:hypothetical protein